jgi:hypothetical protein
MKYRVRTWTPRKGQKNKEAWTSFETLQMAEFSAKISIHVCRAICAEIFLVEANGDHTKLKEVK